MLKRRCACALFYVPTITLTRCCRVNIECTFLNLNQLCLIASDLLCIRLKRVGGNILNLRMLALCCIDSWKSIASHFGRDGHYPKASNSFAILVWGRNPFDALQWIACQQDHARPAILVVNTLRVSLITSLQGRQDYCWRYKDFLGTTIDFGLIQPILGSM